MVMSSNNIVNKNADVPSDEDKPNLSTADSERKLDLDISDDG
jgi:hypothetical protein